MFAFSYLQEINGLKREQQQVASNKNAVDVRYEFNLFIRSSYQQY